MEKIYFKPKTGYTGADVLAKRSKCNKKAVVKWLELQPAYTLHKPARKKYARNKVIVSRIDEQWQLDLVDLQSIAKHNEGYKYLLNCIDLFSKYAWSVPIKTKTGLAIVGAFKTILNHGRQPEKIQTDAGTEFTNAHFQNMLREHNIDFFVTKSELKACVVERFNRTLKERMWRYFTKNNAYKYIDILPDLITGYNNSKHRTIGIEPVNVNENNQDVILKRAFKIEKNTETSFKYDIGDKVRVSKVKGVFEKGYVPNWSEETFIIEKRISRNPVVYVLKDQLGETLEGIFYEPELQKINNLDDIYVIEKIIKSRKKNGKTEYYVKWRGYSDKFNSWVSNLIKI